MRAKRFMLACCLAGSLAVLAGGSALAGEPAPPSSDVGKCSSVFARQQRRDDVSHGIKAVGPTFGADNPGEFFRERAKEHSPSTAVCNGG